MKKLTILGVVFLSMTILFSCGDDKKSKKSKKDREISVKNLDKDIDNEEDAVEAMITITKAQIELVEKAIGPPLLMMDDEDLEDRGEDIDKAEEDVWDKIIDEEWDEDDLEDADNWDEYEDLKDEFEDIMEDYFEKYSEKLNNDMEEEYYEEDDYDDEWSYEFEESFMEECTSKDYLALYDYCECALEEIMYEYTPNELENLDPDEALEFIQFDTDCLELIDYDEY
ncbi:MAG: hypothetical protein HOL56_00790 [Flavobacteriales bacterium]|nr:hypothetical protein [Flavobacteriales bacterium]MBT5771390.1 hypothetical protein [Flavobacteriaceae bacterium]MBT7620107.1 hypothetical protein [Flavobacteriales bacterium]